MKREMVTEDRLLEILNEGLRQSPKCDGTTIRGDPFPSENGPWGCNWELDLIISSENGPDRLCNERIERVLEDAYRSYNIMWDPA